MHSESMSMNQFVTDVQKDLQKHLSRMYPDTRVVQQEVKKVQGESYRGLMIRQDGHEAAPVFNVEKLYDQLSTRSYDSVLGDLIRQAVEHIENPLNVVPEEFMDYGFMKDKLMAQVISLQDNAERLTEIPHQEMKDMAVIYRFMLGEDNRRGVMSVTVTNAIKKMISLLGRCSNNLNQYARKANQTGSIYWADIQDLKERLNEIYDMAEKILIRLNALQG